MVVPVIAGAGAGAGVAAIKVIGGAVGTIGAIAGFLGIGNREREIPSFPPANYKPYQMENIQKDFEADVIHIKEIAWRVFCSIYFSYVGKNLINWQLEPSLGIFDNNFKEAERRNNKKKCFSFILEVEKLIPKAKNKNLSLFLKEQTVMWSYMISSQGAPSDCRSIVDITYDSTNDQEELSTASRAGSAASVRIKKEI